MPGPYVDGINAFVIAVDGYKQETADLIEASLKDSMVWHVSLGWKPAKRAGGSPDYDYQGCNDARGNPVPGARTTCPWK